MNKKILSILATGCLMALMIALPAQAQMPGTRMRVTIPFDFIVSGKTFPAGNYEIKRISDSPQGLVIQNVYEKHEHVIFETQPVETRKIPDRSEIVFHRYGDSYFLSDVWTAGDETGQELFPSRTERRLSREMASNGAEPESVLWQCIEFDESRGAPQILNLVLPATGTSTSGCWRKRFSP